jgi:hypothetical protein
MKDYRADAVFLMGAAVAALLLCSSTTDRSLPTRFLQRSSSSRFGLNPGILESMNCFRNNWSEAIVVKMPSSSVVNSKESFFMV